MNIMKTYKIIALIYCICVWQQSFAQLPIILQEDFDGASPYISTGDYTNYRTKIQGGKLVFDDKNPSSLQYILFSKSLRPDKDFIIGSKFSISPIDTLMNGLLWGGDEDLKHLFRINQSGRYDILHLREKEWDFEMESTYSPHIKIGADNILAVAKKGDKILYFINGQQVHTSLAPRTLGGLHGLLIGSTHVEIDNFTIRQDIPPINLVAHPNNGYVKEDIGNQVNSVWGEISPKVSSDGQMLFVCRANHPQNTGKGPDQDAWFAERLSDGEEWGALKNMGRPVNDEKQNAVASISSDKNTLLLNYDGRSDPGLMRSVRTMDGWSKPERVLIENFYNHNNDAEFALAPNGKVLVYSVERDDTYGEKDLYVSFLRPDDSWTAPKNLGATVNTFTTDFGPYIAADNRTLYFGSMGHTGYGSSDIFVTKRLDDTWTNWSEPKNLGPEINGAGWDAYYSITASGKEAYMSTATGRASSDIVRIKLEKEDEEAKPDPIVLVKGRVFDQKTKQPMAGDIVYEDLTTGKEIGIARSNPRTGTYQIALPYGVAYGFLAKAKGHISVSESIDLSKKGEYKEIVQDLYLAPIEVGETVKMTNIFFKMATPYLLESSYPELERVVKTLQENPSLKIKVAGHTDNLGPEKRLQKLSEARADAVKEYLVEKGVQENRVICVGFGGNKPIADNSTQEGQQLNRRVEFEVMEF